MEPKDNITKYNREYYQKNKDKIVEQKRKYRQANKDRIAKRKRKYNQANKKYAAKRDRKYYQKNKARILEQKSNKRKIERDELRQWAVDNGYSMPEKRSPELRIVQNQNSRARQVGNAATLTLEQWMAILKAHEFKCAYCNGEYEVLEHITPIGKGGGTTMNNCVPACRSCNTRKKNKEINELGEFQDDVTAAAWQQMFWVAPTIEEEAE